jgi:hypothetical protein
MRRQAVPEQDHLLASEAPAHLVLHTLRTTLDPDLAEAEAWRFAGALLFPREAAEEMLVPPVTLRVLIGVIGLSPSLTKPQHVGFVFKARFDPLAPQ